MSKSKKTSKLKALKHFYAVHRSEMKKRSTKYCRRRKKRIASRQYRVKCLRELEAKPYIDLQAPINFSLIENTNEVIEYINNGRDLLHKKEKINLNIENVDKLTSDAIALLAACANDTNFTKGGRLKGNAPSNPQLKKLFFESGFYRFVSTSL